MALLLKNAHVIDPQVGLNETADILIRDGKIVEIGQGLSLEKGIERDLAGKIVVPGLVDMHVHLRDPGFTDKEDIYTGCRAAAAGDEAALYERARSPLLRGVRAADVSLRAAHRRGRAAALYALLGAARRGELLHALRTAFPSAMGLLGGGAVLLCAISGRAAAVAPKSLW